MSFTSIGFYLFFAVVFCLYWVLKRYKIQNVILLVSSYFFYCFWDWRCAFLLMITTLSSFFTGYAMEKNPDKQKTRKFFNVFNVVFNLLILGVFKYFNFFADSLVDLFNLVSSSKQLDYVTLRMILPVGISFYTFKALSYTLDIYKKELKATNDIVAFSAYLSFFAELPAGPIDKAARLLPQFEREREFKYSMAVDGLRQILWGLFKKVVVANNCAIYVNAVFGNHGSYSWLSLVIASFMFTVQIYGDFSGYSDIAIGLGKLLGFDLMKNFKYPYFSRNIAEFWRRWHISLTSWFRDYVYIPLGGNRCSKAKIIRNTIIVYLVSGLWHGANWTFVVWGGYHALLFLPLILTGNNKKYKDIVAQGRLLPSGKEFLQMLTTFVLASIGWIIFQSNNITEAFEFIKGIFVGQSGLLLMGKEYILYLGFALVMFVVEWFQRDKEHGLDLSQKMPTILRYSIYLLMFCVVYLFLGNEQTFIYMKF